MGSQRVDTTERLDTYTQGYLEVGDSHLEPGTGQYSPMDILTPFIEDLQLPCQVEIPCQDFNMECLISTLFDNFLNYFIGLN